MIWFRGATAALWLLAGTGALLVAAGAGGRPWRFARWLGEHGGPEYPLWIGWTVLAPVLLAVAALFVRRTPWVWVVIATVHVLSVALAVARLAHLVPWWGWTFLAAVATSGAVSIATVPRNEGFRRPTAGP